MKKNYYKKCKVKKCIRKSLRPSRSICPFCKTIRRKAATKEEANEIAQIKQFIFVIIPASINMVTSFFGMNVFSSNINLKYPIIAATIILTIYTIVFFKFKNIIIHYLKP